MEEGCQSAFQVEVAVEAAACPVASPPAEEVEEAAAPLVTVHLEAGGGGGGTPPNLGGGGNPPDDNTAGGADSLASLFQNGSFCCAVGDPTLRSFAGPSPFLMSSKRSSMQNGFGESSP